MKFVHKMGQQLKHLNLYQIFLHAIVPVALEQK